MRLENTTVRLVALFVCLLIADVVGSMGTKEPTALPTLASFVAADVTEISLSQGDTRLVLERTGARAFSLTSPIQQSADFGAVNAILSTLYAGVSMAVRVDEGGLSDYGLDGQTAINVALTGVDIDVQFVVGVDSAGGTTFVRFPNDDVVYRARIGGRHKYEKGPTQWRNRMVVDRTPESFDRIYLSNDEEDSLEFSRQEVGLDAEGKTAFSPWQWGHKRLSVDQSAVDALLRSLSSMRAGDLLTADFNAGLDTPVATGRLVSTGGDDVTLKFGRTDGGTYVKRDDQTTVYRIAPSIVSTVMAGAVAWQDRALMIFPGAQIRSMRVSDASFVSQIDRDAATGELTIVRPRGVDTDRRSALYAARKLSALRADSVVDVSVSDAGFGAATTIRVTLLDGSSQTVEIGGMVPTSAVPQLYIRSLDQPHRVGIIDAKFVTRLLAAWSR